MVSATKDKVPTNIHGRMPRAKLLKPAFLIFAKELLEPIKKIAITISRLSSQYRLFPKYPTIDHNLYLRIFT